MATGIPARLTPAEGRKFGLTVGIAFLVLTAITAWRGHETAAYVLGGLGGTLVLGGLAAPTLLGPVQRAWMGLAHLLSKVTTPVFMGVVYFVVITPTGALMRLFGRNPMVHAPEGAGHWMSRADKAQSSLQRQF